MRPSSSVGPNRCFSARSIRSAWCRSPSNERTVSTTCSSVRGPASDPSLVTWPTSSVAIPSSLASRCTRIAPSRTWLTEPGPPGASGSCTAWIESIAITSGRIASACAHTCGNEVSHTTSRSGASVPSRPARSRTCAADSSAHTSRHRAPSAAIAPRPCSTSVLLPMPGSPPTRVTEPATRPPPSTRSSSGMFVARRGAPSGSTSASGTGQRADLGPAPAARPPGRRRRRASPIRCTAGTGRATWATRGRRTRTGTEQVFVSWRDCSPAL